jgi:pseudaminic acid cytidylyltransferase
MSCLCIIPARGGSKRIKKKNIRAFSGKPIIAYAIENALGAELFDRVIVSTDDPEIAATARRYGAEVPFLRPAEISDDFTGTTEVIKHALGQLLSDDKPINFVCCLYATTPLLQVRYLKQGLAMLEAQPAAGYCFSVSQFSYPVQRALLLDSDGYVKPMFPEQYRGRSQDKVTGYHDAGQFYWGTKDSFLRQRPFVPDSLAVQIPELYVQDIDTVEDWRVAELKYQLLQQLESQ